ncbi:hypothetical protein NW762_012422 [Fusarium torreyae]|uniref:NWD NACHT-NTPase N-terminal domain-containing protein n=1 Tax=Fusarium torreyae TaxID=1237075 RepID=A0A9W8VBC1_9HYPO|nr:hypothetical protein NW762_012422 [Fusarium torreyae]
MKRLSELKKKLLSSESDAEPFPPLASVASTASTAEITTPPSSQSTSSPAQSTNTPSIVPPANASDIQPPSTAAAEPVTDSSPSVETQDGPSSLPERLWNKAYVYLGEEQPGIVKAYQEILEKVRIERTDTTAPDELEILEHCKGIESRQMWRLVYTGLKKSQGQTKRKEFIEGVVDKAVKYSSEAGVVWAGVNLDLESGSSSPSATLRTNLETHVIDVYKKPLLFQMRSVCLYYRNWISVPLRDVTKLDEWTEKLNEVKDPESLIRKDMEHYNSEDLKSKLRGIVKSAVAREGPIESIYATMREEAQPEEKNMQDDKDKECLAALLITDPQINKKGLQNQKGDPLWESYHWIFKSAAYQQFTDDPSSRALWINGPPSGSPTIPFVYRSPVLQ